MCCLDSMGIFDLIDKVGKADEELRGQEIFAAVARGGRRIRTRVAGMVREFKIPRQRTTGLRIFKADTLDSASYVREADEDQIRQYLELLPVLHLILVYQAEGGVWYGFPASIDAYTRRTGGDPTLVAVRLVEGADRFDYVVSRYDGAFFWFDDIDYRTDPEKIDGMRDALRDKDWTRVRKTDIDLPATYALDVKGMAQEDHIAYQLAARRVIQETKTTLEQRLETELHDVNAKLDSFVERGDNIEVMWVNASGQGYTSVIRKEDFRVVTAGICVSGEDRKFDLKSLVGVVNYAEGKHGVVRIGVGNQGGMGEDAYFDIHPEPGDLGDRGRGRW